jgi:hypothetical protein
MHRRVFMAYFVLYHCLIIGFVANFCYVVVVLASPKFRSAEVPGVGWGWGVECSIV